MITISPSLLSCDFLNIESELRHLNKIDDIWLHLDIMDGHFVPNLTFGPPLIKSISKKASMPLDAHLMVNNPLLHIEMMKDINLHNFTFHLEAVDQPLAVIKEAKKHFPSVGLSLRPGTKLELLTEELISSIDLILIMSVEPGFGGQSFIENTYHRLDKVSELKSSFNKDLIIQVDGGVNDLNSHELIQRGANNLVAGSFVFNKGPSSYLNNINQIRI